MKNREIANMPWDLSVVQARRGWLEKDDVLNTHELEELRSYFG